ncbi:unnamed protein product [Linum trigynum]|uniref:Transmembrane protein n=1 Tax=Linum trigynum TaxID=586398 RepID=A0AAV2FF01_9ROSI
MHQNRKRIGRVEEKVDWGGARIFVIVAAALFTASIAIVVGAAAVLFSWSIDVAAEFGSRGWRGDKRERD